MVSAPPISHRFSYAQLSLCRADFAQVHLLVQMLTFLKQRLQGKVCALTTSTAHLPKRTLILPGGIWRRSICSRMFICERKCSRNSKTTKEGRCGSSWPGRAGAQLGALNRSSCWEECVLLPPAIASPIHSSHCARRILRAGPSTSANADILEAAPAGEGALAACHNAH